MSAEEKWDDEEFSAWLAACDEALRAGAAPALPGQLPAQLLPRLQDNLACLQRLQGLRPGRQPPPGVAGPSLARLGRFEIRRELGRGGFGIVFLALDPKLGREVALKVPRVEALLTPELRQRFALEARAAARLDHPNLVPVYEAGQEGEVCYITSAYCPGVSLADWLRQNPEPVPWRAAVSLVATLADAVQHAHSRGVLHRDLKPANVILQIADCGLRIADSKSNPSISPSPPSSRPLNPQSAIPLQSATPKITDFGLAKFSEEDGLTLTGDGTLVGTPSYMAPEQAAGRSRDIGTAADLWALGVMLYELLTGRRPFEAESTIATLQQVREREPVAPRRLRPEVPRDLETICLRCLEKDPARRYASAAELADDLRRLQEGRSILARRAGVLERAIKWTKRRPAVAGLLATLLLGGVVGLSALFWQWQRAETALLDSESARRAEQAQARALERTLYQQSIALADRDWWANNPARAAQLLEQCPQHLRGWEWHYLHNRGRRELTILKAPPTPAGEPSGFLRVAFNADGSRLATLGHEGTVTLWDVGRGTAIHRRHEPWLHVDSHHWALALRFTTGGRLLAAAPIKDQDPAITLRDLEDGREIRGFRSRAGAIVCMALSDDGRCLAARCQAGNGYSDEIVLWDTTTGQTLATIRNQDRAPTCLAFDRAGQRLGVAYEGHRNQPGLVKVFALPAANEVFSAQGGRGYATALAFSPGGERLALASSADSVPVWDLATGAQVLTLRGHEPHICGVVYHADGHWLATAGRDKTVRLWDAATGEELRVLRGHTAEVIGADLHGQRLVSTSMDGTARLWDLQADPDALCFRGHTYYSIAAAFHPDGERVASVSADKTVRLWHASTGQQLAVSPGQGGPLVTVAFHPAGHCLAAAGWEGDITLWETETLRELRRLRGHSGRVHGVVFLPDGRTLASGSADRTIKLWDVATGEVRRTLKVPSEVHAVACSRDGRWLAAAAQDGTAQVWDLTDPQAPRVLQAHANLVRALGFSPDGLLATGGDDQQIKLWDPATGQEIRVLRGHTDGVNGLVFHPDRRRLASAGSAHGVIIWDLETGHELLTLKQPAGTGIAFSPDGGRLVTASADSIFRVWDGRPAR